MHTTLLLEPTMLNPGPQRPYIENFLLETLCKALRYKAQYLWSSIEIQDIWHRLVLHGKSRFTVVADDGDGYNKSNFQPPLLANTTDIVEKSTRCYDPSALSRLPS